MNSDHSAPCRGGSWTIDRACGAIEVTGIGRRRIVLGVALLSAAALGSAAMGQCPSDGNCFTGHGG